MPTWRSFSRFDLRRSLRFWQWNATILARCCWFPGRRQGTILWMFILSLQFFFSLKVGYLCLHSHEALISIFVFRRNFSKKSFSQLVTNISFIWRNSLKNQAVISWLERVSHGPISSLPISYHRLQHSLQKHLIITQRSKSLWTMSTRSLRLQNGLPSVQKQHFRCILCVV